MKHLGTLIPDILNGYGLTDSIVCEKLKRDWSLIFKEPLSSHMEPYKFTDGELLIKVDSHIWLNELNFLKNNIIEKLTPYGVKNITFTFGKIFKKDIKDKRKQRKDYKFYELNDEDNSFIEDTISCISNQDLKSIIKNAIKKSLLINKGKP